MRRVLFTAFLSLTAFSVLGGNFLQVTAPSAAGELGEFETRQNAARAKYSFVPAGATRLSGEPVPGVQAPSLAPLPEVASTGDHSIVDGERSAGPIEVREEYTDIDRDVSVREPLFLSTWAEVPMAAVHYLGLANDTYNTSAGERNLPVDVERNSTSHGTLPYFITALAQMPKAIFSRRSLESAPEMPKAPAPDAFAVNAHDVASNASLNDLGARTTADGLERSNGAVPASDVTAIAAAPFSDFSRQRIVDVPASPVFAIPEAINGEHVAMTASAASYDETRAADAPALSSGSVLPYFIAALSEAPASVFARPRIVAEPAAPVPTAFAANAHDANLSSPTNSARDRGESSTIEPAPRSAIWNFVAAIAEVPSAVIESIRPSSLPEAPVAAPMAETAAKHDVVASDLVVADTERNVNAAPELNSVPAVPVAITANPTMTSAMLTPMNRDVLVHAPLVGESSLAAADSRATLSTQFDRAFAPTETVVKANAPVLISGRPEFAMDLLKPMNAATANPFAKLSGQEELAALQRQNNYCDPNWVGPPIRFSQTVQLKLEDLINQLHQRFGVNFILGAGVGELPLNVKAGSIPWNTLLRSQLFISGVRARCIDDTTIELVLNNSIANLQDMADVETRFVKLRFLQRTGSGTVDLANRSQGSNQGGQGGGCGGNNQGGTSSAGGGGGGGGGGQQQGQTVGQLTNNKYDKLIVEIEKILGLRSMTESAAGGQGGQGGGAQQEAPEVIRTNRFVTEIPGRNILAIRATKEEHALIDEFIRRADRAPFQVVIKGLVYTANQDRIRDIGVETTITGGTADGRTTGGLFGDTLGVGTLFDFSTVIGTFDFNVQATAFQQNGIISVKSRPFATVIDGLCTTLDVGRQLPIVIDSTLGGQGDVVFVNAANNLAVTPYVLDDENGNPMAVTLELRLTANDIDSSVTARGVPAISARSIQTQLLLNEDKTAILGGFTVDSDSKTDRKVPGLGDIPVIGELFRRRIRDARVNRLYFAISVDVITYPDPIKTVDVPGATTQPPSITPEQKRQGDKMEPKQVIAVPTPTTGP